jgi:S-adenosylmethionine synthetase
MNGLITPYHPISLEASLAKNPVSHIGKVYNHFAFDLSRAIFEHDFAEEANVFIISQIGKPITQSQLLHIKLNNSSVGKNRIEDLAAAKFNELPHYRKKNQLLKAQ